MRAVIGKEFRELLVVALPMWIVAGIVAAAEIAGSWDHTEDMVGTAIIGGLALGLAQGLLDQLRRDDAFFKHRPLSAERLQVARTVAGLLVLAIALLAFFASLWITTWIDTMQLARLRVRIGADVLPYHDPIHYGLATHALVVSLAIASWALARYVTGLRPYALVVPACLVVPVAAWAVVSRAPTIPAALLLTSVLGVLFLGLVQARESRRRGPVSRLLLLGILGLIALEGALWARSSLSWALQWTLPRYGLDAEGEVRTWDWTSEGGIVELDDARDVVRRWPLDQQDEAPSTSLRVQGSLRGEDDTLAYEQFDDPRFLVGARRARRSASWADPVATALYAEQRRRAGEGTIDYRKLPRWSFVGGLFLCQRGVGLGVEAWVGPDGFHEGEPPGGAARFPPEATLFGYEILRGPWVATVLGTNDSYVLRLDRDPEVPSLEPIRLDVERRAFVPYEGPLSGPPAVVAHGRSYWLLDETHGLLALRALAGDEYVPSRTYGYAPATGPGGLETWIVPQHPTRYGARLRYFDMDGRERVGEARLEPVDLKEKLPAAAMGLLGVLRPPVLNAWAFLSEGPRSRGAMNRWWWRDPFFSSRSCAGWFVASLALGIVMALLGWRSARRRVPTRAAQLCWVAAAFLLGPLGLLWMKLAIGRTAVLPVGDGKRAVNLERTPDNPAPWPEPERTGAEVFV